MWLLYGIIALVVCSCISSAINEGQEAEKKKQMPDQLCRMLAQEFPAFATDFTYAKCLQCVTWLNSKDNTNLFVTEYVLFGDNKIKVRDPLHAGNVYAASVAPLFSPALAVHAKADPVGFFGGFQRAYGAAKMLSS